MKLKEEKNDGSEDNSENLPNCFNEIKLQANDACLEKGNRCSDFCAGI